VRRAPRHHVAVRPHHLHPRGRRGPVLPLAPSGGRGVVVRDLHHGHAVARGGGRHWRC
jgi:hypothetical protein